MIRFQNSERRIFGFSVAPPPPEFSGAEKVEQENLQNLGRRQVAEETVVGVMQVRWNPRQNVVVAVPIARAGNDVVVLLNWFGMFSTSCFPRWSGCFNDSSLLHRPPS